VNDKTVLVTGSSKGLGKAIAISLAKSGFNIVIHYHSDERGAKETASEIKANAAALGQDIKTRIVQFDIADELTSQQVLEADINEHGAYYGVVCNAGVHCDAAFPAMTGDEWRKVVHTNLDGFYHVVHPLIMPMIQRRDGGRIVAISSVSGILGNRGQVNYSASKAGLIGAVKALALELAKRKITVNCVAPGIIETEMTAALPKDIVKQLVPMKRAGTDSEVAATVDVLFSQGANYITRQGISVDGGLS
jgi:3-oxoacyl-[acyl-carrier protein] reductase